MLMRSPNARQKPEPVSQPSRLALRKLSWQLTRRVTLPCLHEVLEAAKRQRPGFVLLDGAEVVPSEGRGDCLLRALAQAISVVDKKKSGHRSIRAGVTAWMSANPGFLEPYWGRCDPDDKSFSGTFEEYIALVKQTGKRAGYLEIFALARGHGLNILVMTAAAHPRFKATSELDPYVVLKFDASHYEWCKMDSGGIAQLWQNAADAQTKGGRAGVKKGLCFSGVSEGSSAARDHRQGGIVFSDCEASPARTCRAAPALLAVQDAVPTKGICLCALLVALLALP